MVLRDPTVQASIDEWLKSFRSEMLKAIAVAVVAGVSLMAAQSVPLVQSALQATVTVNVALLSLIILVVLVVGSMAAYLFFKPKVENLKALASTDELTNLWNTREFSNRINSEIQRVARYGEPLSIILIDLDGFKSVNDTYGYEAGDAVLKEFAEIVRQEIRETDSAFRYKMGDEFAIILPNTALLSARVPAERLRGRVEHYRFTFPKIKHPISLTMCAGVVSVRTSQECVEDISRKKGRSANFASLVSERLQARVERALAKAKRTKNSVITEGTQEDLQI